MHSDQELATFSEHVLYEMAMLVGIPRKFDTSQDDVTRNALLESFAIHARQLVNFFYDHAEAGEIVASDYFDDPIREWKMVRGKEESDLKGMVNRVSVEIAHLTLKRLEKKKDWNLLSIVKEIERRCLLFLQRVRPGRISGPDKEGFLRLLQEHNDWLVTLSSSQAQNWALSTATPGTSGFTMIGKTCPPENGLSGPD
jgi:hypothetical protein